MYMYIRFEDPHRIGKTQEDFASKLVLHWCGNFKSVAVLTVVKMYVRSKSKHFLQQTFCKSCLSLHKCRFGFILRTAIKPTTKQFPNYSTCGNLPDCPKKGIKLHSHGQKTEMRRILLCKYCDVSFIAGVMMYRFY